MLIRLHLFLLAILGGVSMLPLASNTFAQSLCDCISSDAECCCEPPPPAPPALPVYCGCLCERTALTGDWHGRRMCMLESGMKWDIDETAFFFGVASGGREQRATFAGHGDIVMNWDLGKAGIQEGAFLKLRAEHRYGQSISAYQGSILPATIATNLPAGDSDELYLTNVIFTQFLSESFAVFAGKIDTLDGDPNLFAHGRGKDQFSNLAFVINPLLLRAVPYSSLAAGFVVLDELKPVFQFTVMNATDTTRTSGFSELFEEGVLLSAQYTSYHQWNCLPGQQVFGGAWNSREYVSLGQDPRVILPDVPIAQTSGTWGVFWNASQYLVTYDDAPGKGWGLFARASIGDDRTNPMAYFLSAGIGGNSPITCRAQDTFGIGYYYLGMSDEIGPLLQAVVGPIGNGQGVEMFYNYEVAPWFHITADAQVLVPERELLDTAYIFGLRAKVDF